MDDTVVERYRNIKTERVLQFPPPELCVGKCGCREVSGYICISFQVSDATVDRYRVYLSYRPGGGRYDCRGISGYMFFTYQVSDDTVVMRYRGIFAVLLDGGRYGCRWISEYIGISI